MVKWLICRQGDTRRCVPCESEAVGIAYQKTHEDPPVAEGFIDMEAFNLWLLDNGYVAYNTKLYPQIKSDYATIYSGK